MNLKDIVREGNTAMFQKYVHGSEGATLYYWVGVKSEEGIDYYQFPIPASEIENTTINYKEKALNLMRWIRKAIDNETLIKVGTY
jgi:hypothetical protein